MRQIRIVAVVLFAGFISSGCMQMVHFYPGPERSPLKLAGLRVERWEGGGLDLQIDGKTVEWDRKGDYPVWVYLIPGRYVVKWNLTLRDKTQVKDYSGPDRSLKMRDVEVSRTYRSEGILDTKKGKYYGFQFKYLEGRKRELKWERDYREYLIEVKDTATWIEEYSISLSGPKVVAGTKPAWLKRHTCEICGERQAAAPCTYGCSKCRREEFKQ